MTFAGTAAGRRTPGGYFHWLRLWGAVMRAMLRAPAGERLHSAVRRLVLTENPAQETLLKGFPGLVAVPEALFPGLPELLPLAAFPRADTAEELLGAVHALERACGEGFDWDAFFTACEKRNRRTDALLSLAERIRRRADVRLDTASAHAALAALAAELATERKKEI